jgi:23S rRNA (pseudouridine1915-N3)-methyltransferase
MQILLVAVGRLRGGPEADLSNDYITRAQTMARAARLGAISLLEVEAKPPSDPRKEAAALYKATPDGAIKILLDERGEDWGSRKLADKIGAWRDSGAPALAFWIGGADGVSQSVRDQADLKIAFGRQTWPHRLVRVMAAEQIYRSVTLLCGTPYHRD